MTTSQRLPAGTLLGGRYRLLEPLPGAGRSWHARDEVDRRDLVARVVVLPAAMPAADRDLARQRALQDAAAGVAGASPGDCAGGGRGGRGRYAVGDQRAAGRPKPG